MMRWAIGAILVVLWLLSFVGPVRGWLIHLILAVATVVLLVNVLMLDPENSWT
jgi:hypothetical protein